MKLDHKKNKQKILPDFKGKKEKEKEIMSFFILFYFLMFYLFIFGGEGKEKEERNTDVWLPLMCPLLGTWPATQACALTGN